MPTNPLVWVILLLLVVGLVIGLWKKDWLVFNISVFIALVVMLVGALA